jgi:cellobiose phosphorylase
MQYGFFDDRNKEYVINKPDTPRPWSNYLGSTEYGAIITNHAGGYSFFKSAMQGRFTRLRGNYVPLDQPGRYLYVRDNADGDYWSASWQPVGKDLSKYKSVCRHGTAYTVIESEYKGIRTESTYFVPLGQDFECWIFSVKNTTTKKRDLSFFTFAEFASEWNFTQDIINLQYAMYIIKSEVKGNVIETAMCGNMDEDPENFQNRDQSRRHFMALVGAKPAGFDTSREAFLGGSYNTYANPKVVIDGKCRNSLADGDNACGTFQVKASLNGGASTEFMIILGPGRADREAKKVLSEFSSIAACRQELVKVKEFWHAKLGRFMIDTPDKEFNSMVNVWNAYNNLITFYWSRAASMIYQGERDGLGYRDSVQDIVGVASIAPEEAGKRLELLITGQVSNGGAMPVVKQFAHKPGHEKAPEKEEYRSDDCLWLFNAIPTWVKETGNWKFYSKELPYADKGKDTVFGHMKRAIEFNLERSGKHGLPCGLAADWNDCLKFGYKGESMFVALQLRYALNVFVDLAKRLEKPKEAVWAEEQLAKLDKNIQKTGWDGKWFIRGITEKGLVLGSSKTKEGSIFLNTQSWAVLSGAATPIQGQTAMKSVAERLVTEYGILLCDPPFVTTDPQVVRARLFNPGMKENAGIFSHTQGWAVMAETYLGNGKTAYDYYRAFMPAAYNTRAEVRQIEPYVHCQSTHGKHSKQHGVSRVPWLSGTASWAYFSATQYILGMRPDYEGITIDPCVPADWKQFRIRRVFRSKALNITVRNPNGVEKGVMSIRVNGDELRGGFIPLKKLKPDNEIVVTMG